jgi:hypothetical protein
MLRVNNPRGDSAAFVQMRARLRQMPAAPTTEQAVRTTGSGRTRTPNPRGTGGTIGTVERPSSSYRTYREGIFSVSVPSNWRELGQGDTVTFAPDGGYGNVSGRDTFTHGMEFGVASTSQRNVQNATDELINSLARSNSDLSRASGYSQTSIDNRRGLRTVLENVSEATGERERILLFSTLLPDGRLFYALGVAPRSEFQDYQNVFNQVVRSIQLNG